MIEGGIRFWYLHVKQEPQGIFEAGHPETTLRGTLL